MNMNHTLDNSSWFGELPLHWNCEKIGSLFTERKTKVSDKEYPPLSVAKIGVVPQLETAVKTDAGDNRKLVRRGDFVINSRSDRKGSCGLSEFNGSVSLINIVLTPRSQWNSRYVHYLLRSQLFSEEYYRNGRGIVADLWTTRYSEMKSILLPVPPRSEQDKIVRFLDWKVSNINRLINIKRRRITEFEELKTAMISKAVTRGLKQNVPMKDSGIEWLGDIPEHWTLVRNNNIFQEVKNVVGDNAETYPLLSLTTKGVIYRDVISGKGKFPTDFDTYKIVRQGDMVFCLFDIDETPRTVGLSDYDGMVTGAYTIFHVKNINPQFAYYYYLSLDSGKALRPLYSGLRKTINVGTFLGTKSPLPPRKEQEQIVRFLDKKVSCLNKIIDLSKNQIDELEDLKRRIIADAVTGKIDVHDIEIPEYEFTAEKFDTDDYSKESGEAEG